MRKFVRIVTDPEVLAELNTFIEAGDRYAREIGDGDGTELTGGSRRKDAQGRYVLATVPRGVFPVSAYLDPLQRLILADAGRIRRRGTARLAGSTTRCGTLLPPEAPAPLVVDMTQHHTSKMATYTISSAAERGSFDVAIVGNNGTRQTVLGFRTYAAAEAWIAEDERRTNEEIHSSFRMQWRF